MKDKDAIILAVIEGEDVCVAYASPEAEVLVDGTNVVGSVHTEIYTLTNDGERDCIIIQDGGDDYEGTVWHESHREFHRLLRDEVNIRRNGDKRLGLIGG